MKRQVIRITEDDLHRMIREAVNNTLNEISHDTIDSAQHRAASKVRDAQRKYGIDDPRSKHAQRQYDTFSAENLSRYSDGNEAYKARYMKNKEDRMNGWRTYKNGKGWRTDPKAIN